MNDVIQKVRIGCLNFQDPFFDSLRHDYDGFDNWLYRKSNEEAYVLINQDNYLVFFISRMNVRQTAISIRFLMKDAA